MKKIPAKNIYIGDYGWHKGRFHFSFGDYIDPDNIDSIYHALKTLIPDLELRNKLIANGKAIIKNYNWYETVKITHEHYLKLAG